MKKWITPRVEMSKFAANEYVAACWSGSITLECAIPGTDAHKVGDGTSARNGEDGKPHGLCANAAAVTFSGSRTGYEVVNNKTDYNRPISNVVISDQTATNGEYYSNISLNVDQIINDGTYMATWTSTDGSTGTYYHYGAAKVVDVKRGIGLS